MGQNCHLPSQLLNLLDSSKTPHPNEGATLIRIGLYASLGQHASQEFAYLDPKQTVFGV